MDEEQDDEDRRLAEEALRRDEEIERGEVEALSYEEVMAELRAELGIHRVTSVQVTGKYQVRVGFEDGTQQEIDLEPILEGELYGPLRDPGLFARVEIDPEVHTLVWPNGADFDPTTLHDWPRHEAAMRTMARRWALTSV